MVWLKKTTKGVTLIEIVVVVAIVAILSLLFLMGYLLQLQKGRDAKRKADLMEIKRGMEDYFNDYGCYPKGSDLQNLTKCNTEAFKPWLRTVLCDPFYRTPYLIKVEDSECPRWFAIYTNLEYTNDPQLETNECSNYQCLVNKKIYNFGTSSDNITAGAVDDDGGTLEAGMACETSARSILSPTGDCNACPDNKCLCCIKSCFVDEYCQIPCEASEAFCNTCF